MTVTTPQLVDAVGIARSRVRRRGIPAPRWARRLAGPLLLIVVWQLGISLGIIDERMLPAPGDVLGRGWDMIQTGELSANLWASLERVLIGLVIGVTIGVSLALVAAVFRLGDDLVDSAVQVLRAIPVVALTPLFILWFGLGEQPKIAIIAIATTFPVYINTFAAVRSVDQGLIEMSAVFGLSRAGLVRRIALPAALPGFLVGLRYSLAVSWLVLIFAEQINTEQGLGFLLNQSMVLFQADMMMVVIVVYGLLGFVSDLIVRLLERRLLTWRSSFAGA